ncbi:MAG TPA: hypothetical protein VKP30_06650 [Polyangiaceae bacterium]|nr:hypothetical protein [Polyangiaceae bacterium]
MTERVLGRSEGVVFSTFVAVTTCACMDQSRRDGSEPSDVAVVEQAVQTAAEDNDPTLCAGQPRPKPLPNQVRRNVILMIGDGMQLEDEIAISRYLYGTDDGLLRHSFPHQGYVTTWDVTSYNKYAALAGKPSYDPTDYDPIIGYDPAQAGVLPFPLEDNPLLYSYLSRIAASSNGWWAATDSASASCSQNATKA